MTLLGQRQRTLLLMAKQAATASGLCQFFLPPNTEGPRGYYTSSWFCGTLSLDDHFFYSKPALSPGRRHNFIPQGCLLQTQPWQMSRGGVAFLAYQVNMCRGAQGPWWIDSLGSLIPLCVQLNWIEFSTCQEIYMGLMIQRKIKHDPYL